MAEAAEKLCALTDKLAAMEPLVAANAEKAEMNRKVGRSLSEVEILYHECRVKMKKKAHE